MIQSALENGEYVAVAVAFDDHTLPLAQFGAALAAKLGKKLALIHVAETPAIARPVQPFVVPSVIWDKMLEYVAAGREQARKRLNELKESLPGTPDAKLVVLEGLVVDGLAKEATRLGACLLLVGTSVRNKLFVPRGFSTALTLMASSPVPVMAMDTERHIPGLDLAFRILLADDLGEQSEPAVQLAAALADSLPKTWVHHVHVSAFSKANLDTALKNAAVAAHTSMTPGEAEEIFKAVRAKQRDALEARFGDYREYVEAAGGKYSSEVVTGDVGQELDAAVKTYVPDVLVFGRHQSLHRQPFFFGRMPFKAMMAYNRPVLVVPGPADR